MWHWRKNLISSADGYDCRKEPPEVPGTGLNVTIFKYSSYGILHAVLSNLLISRAITPQAITFSGGWGKSGWGTATSIYPVRPFAQAALSSATF